jgi:uncharacterized protein
MKTGARALGIAESYRCESDHAHDGSRSTVAGAVVRADRVVDGLAFGSWTVGGTDATETICRLIDDLDRPDVRYVVLGAVAPAWYNVLDLFRIHDVAQRPVLAVTLEASDGLEPGLEDSFSGTALDERLELYRQLPARRTVSVNDETVYVRSLGLDEEAADEIVRAFTPEGGRPEPVRVAKLAARAADSSARSSE